jgi:hypothetical protein
MEKNLRPTTSRKLKKLKTGEKSETHHPAKTGEPENRRTV